MADSVNPHKGQEGWALIAGSRKFHYQRDGISLCRRYGLYRGPLEPDTGPSPDDCSICRRKLDKEKDDQP